MSTEETQTEPDLVHARQVSGIARAKKIGRGVVVAGTLAALSLTAVPTTAHAGRPGVGAAVGLGILGGVIAGAAIAAATSPGYATPPPAYYYYPQQGYYPPAPTYYAMPQPYYGSTPYGYPQYNYYQ